MRSNTERAGEKQENPPVTAKKGLESTYGRLLVPPSSVRGVGSSVYRKSEKNEEKAAGHVPLMKVRNPASRDSARSSESQEKESLSSGGGLPDPGAVQRPPLLSPPVPVAVTPERRNSDEPLLLTDDGEARPLSRSAFSHHDSEQYARNQQMRTERPEPGKEEEPEITLNI